MRFPSRSINNICQNLSMRLEMTASTHSTRCNRSQLTILQFSRCPASNVTKSILSSAFTFTRIYTYLKVILVFAELNYDLG